MEDLKGQIFIEQKLKPYLLWYTVMASLCIVLLTTSMIFSKRLSVLNKDEDALMRVKSSLVKANKTIGDMDSFIKQVALTAPDDIDSQAPSHYLHYGLDRIKSALNSAQLEIGKVEDRGEEIAMPVTVSGPMNNFQGFIAGLGRLQDMHFPFFLAKGIVLKATKGQNNDTTTYSYEIRADLTMPKTGQAEGIPSNTPTTHPARVQFHPKGAS
jgi:hypothetical protein